MIFGGLFGSGSSKKSSSDSVPKLSSSVANTILGTVGAKSIPSMPASAQKAFELSTNPKADAKDFAGVISMDEALSARVVRVANSVYFDRGRKTETVDDAIVVIGIKELRCLLNANALMEIFPTKHPMRMQLWSNDVATAIIAKYLAQRTAPNKADAVFLAGLMHDVGKLVLLQRTQPEYEKICTMVKEQGISFTEAEAQVYPFDHTEVGLLVAERWNFSDEIIGVVRRHHDSWSSLANANMLIKLVKAADIVAHALGIGHQRGFSQLQSKASDAVVEAIGHLGIPAADAKQVLDSAKRAFELEQDLYAKN